MANNDNNKTGSHATPPDFKHEEVKEAKQELSEAIHASHEVLMSANTVFPFTPFPDTVTIDREKITITHRNFFMVSDAVSTRIDDILNVTANVGPQEPLA